MDPAIQKIVQNADFMIKSYRSQITSTISEAQWKVLQILEDRIYMVDPVNDLLQLQNDSTNFVFDPEYVEKKVNILTPSQLRQPIQLIHASGDGYEMLEEIKGRGFVPAPSPYLFGLGLQYPETISEYKRVASYDENNRTPFGRFGRGIEQFYTYFALIAKGEKIEVGHLRYGQTDFDQFNALNETQHGEVWWIAAIKAENVAF